ncbi:MULTISPECIES: phosphopantetheine-binding protein [unclassified Streptomyces]|uniref:phosphopantetheine-binding protein n=1 Tax=Streptomycetaceae TaxID=2062 RepID=UPI002E76AA8A|nr:MULTISPECIES: phosphopantetheine-binding protein [unclassified Streptomyces]MED7954393.1 phosphopantetheine-binding protein [Streptomyces sp. BE303]MEE1826866.1 phosphopantetheine-binding protein [Streptomyces sp. BE20]
MSPTENADFNVLVELLKDVKSGLEDQPITQADSVVEDLGLDSLDLLQLARKINRRLGVDFDLDSWNETAAEHRRTVGSILAVVEAAQRV